MRLIPLYVVILSIITFRSCDEAEGHENVLLEVDPVYSGGVLELTPYVVYEGDEPTTFHFGNNIAWVNKIVGGGDVLYEYEGDAIDVDQRTTLESDDERRGFTVEIEVNPETNSETIEVHLHSHYFIYNEDVDIDQPNNDSLNEYSETKIQAIEVRPES